MLLDAVAQIARYPSTFEVVNMLLTGGVAFGAGGIWWRIGHLERKVDRLEKKVDNAH